MGNQSSFSLGFGIGCGILAAFVLAPIALFVAVALLRGFATGVTPPESTPAASEAAPATAEFALPEPRAWQDDRGNTFVGRYVRRINGNGDVVVEKDDGGAYVIVSWAGLSPAAREWLIRHPQPPAARK